MASYALVAAPAADKPKKMALLAAMHTLLLILNAMLRHRTPWRLAAA